MFATIDLPAADHQYAELAGFLGAIHSQNPVTTRVSTTISKLPTNPDDKYAKQRRQIVITGNRVDLTPMLSYANLSDEIRFMTISAKRSGPNTVITLIVELLNH